MKKINRKPRYSIRRMSVDVVSVALSSVLVFGAAPVAGLNLPGGVVSAAGELTLQQKVDALKDFSAIEDKMTPTEEKEIYHFILSIDEARINELYEKYLGNKDVPTEEGVENKEDEALPKDRFAGQTPITDDESQIDRLKDELPKDQFAGQKPITGDISLVSYAISGMVAAAGLFVSSKKRH